MEKATFRTLCLAFLLTSTSVFSQGGTDFTGQVFYHDNYPLSGVNAYLKTTAGNVIDSSTTDAEGIYSFENVTPGTYTITFSTGQQEGGIDLNDAFMVMMKLFNIITLDPVQTLAADVNNSGSITWADYFMILIGYLNQGNPFPQPWVFESITTPIPCESRTGFTTGGGSSSGDVNGSLQPDPKGNPIQLESPFLDYTTNSTGSMEFNLSSPQDLSISGMHLVFSIPEELEIIDIATAIPGAIFNVSDHRLVVTWIDPDRQAADISADSPLLAITARSNKITREGQTYSLKLRDESHFIDHEGTLIQGLKLTLPTLNIHVTQTLSCSAYPNPFSNAANIEFTIEEEGQVIIGLFDQAGRMVMEVENGFFSAGQHLVKIDGSRLFPGIYHYRATMAGSDGNFAVGTLIKSK
jgi:hypothetical protein